MNLDNLKAMLNIAPNDTSYDDYLTNTYNLCYKYAISYIDLITPAEDRSYVYRDILSKSVFKCVDSPVNTVKSATLDGVSIQKPEYSSGYFYFPSPISGKKLEIVANVGRNSVPEELNTIVNMMVEFIFKQATKANYFSMPEQKPLTPKDMSFPKYILDFLDSL